MAEEKRLIARIPIVPDDLSNQDAHKNHELVMDFNENDIYIKKGNEYINITGKIKEEIKKIKAGSKINIVTSDDVPPIDEREENNWYFIITRSENAEDDTPIPVSSYIYYGLIKKDSTNYLLISQNMITESDMVPFTIVKNYVPCFYIPVNRSVNFINHDTGEEIDFEIKSTVYALNTEIGIATAYNIYILNLTEEGDYRVDVNLIEEN